MARLDTKVTGNLYKTKDGSLIPEDQYVVFQAQDNAFLPVLCHYWDLCAQMGAEQAQLDGIQRLIKKVREWREANPEKCKVPDLDLQKEGWDD